MVVTRKIEVYVAEKDLELKKNYIHTIYEWRDTSRRLANLISTHKFVLHNVKDFVCMKDEIKEKFYVKDILKEGKGMSENNITYRMCSELVKGKMPSSIYNNLNRQICGYVNADIKDVMMGKISLRSYRNNIGIPFDKSKISFSEKDKRYYFSFYGIPMCCMLGRDRSNNEVMIRRVMDGEYQVCTSSVMIDDNRKKMYLLLVVDIDASKHELHEDKVMYAFLGVGTPIICSTDVNAKEERDSGMKVWRIGSKEQFLHQRLSIQAGLRRCQATCKYSRGGHGRKRKTEAVERWHKKESNYVKTMMHTYSRELVNMAVKYSCGSIVLMKQKEREEKAKEDGFVLRNWSYFGLKGMIEYKCKMEGVRCAMSG